MEEESKLRSTSPDVPQEKETKKKRESRIQETAEQRIGREKAELIDRISHNKLVDINSKVAFILNHFPNTRNSDIDLAIQYWKNFDRAVIGSDDSVTFSQLYKIARMNSLTRARAKIQNTYGLFLANERVRQKRSELDDERREKEIEDQPTAPLISIFCDESGKTQENLIIGSLWVNDPYRVLKIYQALTEWKETEKIQYEFHFSDLNRSKTSKALEFVGRALSEADVLGFKAVIVNRRDIGKSNLDEAIYSLHYQLIVQGLEHEFKSKRVQPPRVVSLTKDQDDGTDKLHLAALKQKLKGECVKYFRDEVTINAVETQDSKTSVFLQLADLFAGSVSRILNKETQSAENHKDEFAVQMLQILGVSRNLDVDINKQDFVGIIKIQ